MVTVKSAPVRRLAAIAILMFVGCLANSEPTRESSNGDDSDSLTPASQHSASPGGDTLVGKTHLAAGDSNSETLAAPMIPFRIRCTARQFEWYWQFPGNDRRLDTDDDRWLKRDLFLPANADVEIELLSDDYAYTLFLPRFDLFEVAVPDRPFTIFFRTQEPDESELLGSQMCGYTHPLLLGKLKVCSLAEVEHHLELSGAPTEPPASSPTQ